MFDFKFDWDKSIETGIESIDIQHQELFSMCRDMEQIILRAGCDVSEKEIMDLLYKLRDYTTYHFYTEELIIKQYNSDVLGQHREQHQAFTSYINSINYVRLVQNPATEFRKIKDYMQEWLFHHILVEDKRIMKP